MTAAFFSGTLAAAGVKIVAPLKSSASARLAAATWQNTQRKTATASLAGERTPERDCGFEADEEEVCRASCGKVPNDDCG
jgi:hypothetical protein